LKTSAIVGLGLAYTGSCREDLLGHLLPFVADDSVGMEIASLAALALGFVYVGSGNGEVAGTILQTLMEREEKVLDEKWARFMALGLALLYLGTKRWSSFPQLALTIFLAGLQDGSDATLETLKVIEHPIAKQAQILVEICAFAGTGNVLRVQGMLHHCDEHIDKDKSEEKEEKKEEEKKEDKKKPDDALQAFAVLGIALIAMGEDIGAEMALRQFNHLV
jgi:26S proteasome regulatory subunit N1